MITNFYCDESCYMEHDDNNLMFLSMISCPRNEYIKTKNEIKQIFLKHSIPEHFEVKSTKVSMGKYDFYKDLIHIFMYNKNLRFRCIIADKTQLEHKKYSQTHEEWDYKMYYLLIEKAKLSDENKVYVDYKDNHSYDCCKTVEEYLNNHFRKEQKKFCIQPMDSKESRLMQINDLLMGLVAYRNKDLTANKAKLYLAGELEEYFKIDFEETNYNDRFNIFRWDGRNS